LPICRALLCFLEGREKLTIEV